MDFIHKPKNTFKLSTLTAFVSVDDDDQEGIIGINLGGTYMPCIGADEERIKSMYPEVKRVCKAGGVKFRVLKFSVREDVTQEVIDKYEK